MNLHGENLVGHATSAQGTHRIQAMDPSRTTPLEPGFAEATTSEVDEAMRLAEAAFDTYRRTSGPERAAFLRAIAEGINGVREDAVARAGFETALPKGRLNGEVDRTCNQLRMFADLVEEGSWVDARLEPGTPDLRRMLAALGPVAVFGASNFPFAFSVAGGDTASALAAGCPVVCKAHQAHPGTSEIVGRCIQEVARAQGLPSGTFSLVHGESYDVGTALVQHPATRAVGFTGSLRGGRALHDAAATRPDPIPVFAEMGSVNPVFVLPGALRERADQVAEGLHGSFVLGVGQFCTNPGVTVLAADAAADRFRDRLAQLTRETPAGTMLHGGIRDAFTAGLDTLRGREGVREWARAEADASPDRTEACAAVLAVEARRYLEDTALAEEVFGPSTLLVEDATPEQYREIARTLDGHLTASVIGTDDDLEENADLIDILSTKVGRVIVNGYPTGVAVNSAMQHGGPYPATTDPRFTSVGTAAIYRFARPVAYQDVPDPLLPEELRADNPRGILRWVASTATRDPLP